MRRETYTASKLVETNEAEGTEMVTKDAQGVETGRRPLTAEELARFQAEGQPTPEEVVLADIAAASSLTALKAALTKWIGG